MVCEQRLPVGFPNEQVLQHHVVGEKDVGRVLSEAPPLLVRRSPVVARDLHMGVSRLLQQLVDPFFLVVRQRVHRVDEQRGDAAALEAGRVLDGVLDNGQQEALGLAGAGSGRDGERPGLGAEQPADRVALVLVRT